MYFLQVKKDKKTVRKLHINSKPLDFKFLFQFWGADEITIRKPVVDVLPTQAEREASGAKDQTTGAADD